MTKRDIIADLSADAKTREPLPTRDTGERVRVSWPKYRKADIYEGHELPSTYDPYARLGMERGTNVKPKGLPAGFHDPRASESKWHTGSRPITVEAPAYDAQLERKTVRRMKPKAKQTPKAKAVLGTIEWDVQYRPDLPANWAEQARKRNWDCISRFLGVGERPTLKAAQKVLTTWRLFDTRIIVDIDDKRKTRDVWFKTTPESRNKIAQLGRIADDGISGR